MGWVIRFLLWATPLAAGAWVGLAPYHTALVLVANSILGDLGLAQSMLVAVQVYAPFDLACFLAMCMASRPATWRMRFRVIAVGIPLLVALQVLAVILVILDARWVPPLMGTAGLAKRLVDLPVGSVLFLNAGVVWLLLLGRTEIQIRPHHHVPENARETLHSGRDEKTDSASR